MIGRGDDNLLGHYDDYDLPWTTAWSSCSILTSIKFEEVKTPDLS